MRCFAPLLALCLAACGPQYVANVVTSEDEIPARAAYFTEEPLQLAEVFRAGCDSPGDEFATLGNGVVQCRIPPTPDLAAFLLLTFDGALEVPMLIIQKDTKPEGDGLLVEMSYFAEVVQKSGAPRRIYFKQPRLDALVDSMLQSAGGETR